MMPTIIKDATSEHGGGCHCGPLPVSFFLHPSPLLPSPTLYPLSLTDVICTKDVSGRKSISITNTQWRHRHVSLGRCQSKWERMLTFITICVRMWSQGRGGGAGEGEEARLPFFTPFNFNYGEGRAEVGLLVSG